MPWKWFHDLPVYKSFKAGEPGTPNLLPIVAPSGVGKTFLANSIIHDLRTAGEAVDAGIGKSLVVNFSFLPDREYHRSVLWMLRSCISQLADFGIDPKFSLS